MHPIYCPTYLFTLSLFLAYANSKIAKGFNMDQNQTPTTPTEAVDTGKLQVRVNSAVGSVPVEDATVQISYTGDPDSIIEEITTNNKDRKSVV